MIEYILIIAAFFITISGAISTSLRLFDIVSSLDRRLSRLELELNMRKGNE